jgi:hypothetical protein
MLEIVEVTLDGQTVYFETETDLTDETEKIGIHQELSRRVTDSFEQALDTITAVMSATVQRVRAFDQAITPDEFQLQFGVKLSGEYGAVVVKAAGEAQLTVTATYKHKKQSKDEN